MKKLIIVALATILVFATAETRASNLFQTVWEWITERPSIAKLTLE